MKITLALGGGGVKGFAHIGVLRALENAGFEVAGIAGTSAGGLMGAVYAAGYSPDEIESRIEAMSHERMYQRMPGDAPSLMGMAGIIEIMTDILGERTFEDLYIPLVVTAVDLDSGTPLAIRHGRLLDAVLATSAVPGVFPPQHLNGRTLVDGGVLNPVPVKLARLLAPDLPVVAVVLSPPSKRTVVASTGRTPTMPTKPRLLASSSQMINRLAGRLRLTQAFNIFLQSVDIAGLAMTDLVLKTEKPEVVIRPHVHQYGLLDKVDVKELSRLGEQAALEALPELRSQVSWSRRMSRRMTSLMHGTPEGAERA